MIALSLLSLLLATTALSAPTRRADDTFYGACNVPISAVTVPSAFDPLPFPPHLVLLGVGVQNYTCNSNGTFDSLGSYAQMYDISCLYGTPRFSTIQKDAFHDWDAYWSFNPFESEFAAVLKDNYGITVDGGYYFTYENGTLVPVWDLTSTGPYAGNPDAIVHAEIVKSIPSPDGPDNISSVQLKKKSGGLANLIYRVDSVQGKAPSTCTPGSYASVKYSANYLFV